MRDPQVDLIVKSMAVPFKPVHITAWSLCSAVGDGRAETLASLRERRTGLTPNDFSHRPLNTWIGRVRGLEAEPLPAQFQEWECRNNRLAWRGLHNDDFIRKVSHATSRYGADRIAVIVGTSTAGIGATEEAYARLDELGRFPSDLCRPIVHSPHALGDFVQHVLGLNNLCVTVSTACSSSAKAFAQGERLLRMGLADAVVVGGVDTLCGSVLFGFNALQLVSADVCRPFDVRRNGINIGEAAGFALLERSPAEGPMLLGYGESSDAYHMSSPHPDGRGAHLAIDAALSTACLESEAIGYINLHGTASRLNDAVEARLVAERFTAATLASSTKGWTGHTLGAAGIVEAGMCLLALESGLAPGTLNSETLDPACGPQIQSENRQRSLERAMSFSFGFGGSNCALVFGRQSSHA